MKKTLYSLAMAGAILSSTLNESYAGVVAPFSPANLFQMQHHQQRESTEEVQRPMNTLEKTILGVECLIALGFAAFPLLLPPTYEERRRKKHLTNP